MNERMLRSGWRRNIGHVKAERCFDCHRGNNNMLQWADGTFFKRCLYWPGNRMRNKRGIFLCCW